MLHRTLLRLSVLVAALGFLVSVLGISGAGAQQDDSKWGRKYKIPPPSSRIEITILRDVNGKPIENAAVIFHPMQGDRDKGVLEVKTNEDGKAVIDVLPIGDTVRLQVIANGFQTYGQDYKIDKAAMSMEIRMKRPGSQYSIYKNSSAPSNPQNDSGRTKPANPPQSATPPASGDKPSGTGTNPQPAQNQPQTPPSTPPPSR